MVNGVSFGSDTVQKAKFEESLSSSVKYSQDQPMASTGLEQDTFEKKGMGTATKAAIGLGVAAATLGLLRGKVDAIKAVNLEAGFSKQEGIMGKAKYVVAKLGQYVVDGVNAVKKLFTKGEAKTGEGAADDAAKAAAKQGEGTPVANAAIKQGEAAAADATKAAEKQGEAAADDAAKVEEAAQQ